MKLQLKFKVKDEMGEDKNVTKTFSPINEEATTDQYIEFAQSYGSLLEATDLEAYLIKVDEVKGE